VKDVMSITIKFTDKEKTIQAEFQKLLPGVIIYRVKSGNEDIINEAHYSIHNINNDRFRFLMAFLSMLTFLRTCPLSI
jgi:hypothetical protein